MTANSTGTLDTFDSENSTLQALVTFAYKEIVSREELNELSKPEFWARLPLRARIAVYVGNLNYQVCNGGFTQWVENGYGECAVELLQFSVKLPKAGPDVAEIVRCVVRKAAHEDVEDLDEYNGTDLSDIYYNLKNSFLHEVETVLNICKTDDELAEWIKK